MRFMGKTLLLYCSCTFIKVVYTRCFSVHLQCTWMQVEWGFPPLVHCILYMLVQNSYQLGCVMPWHFSFLFVFNINGGVTFLYNMRVYAYKQYVCALPILVEHSILDWKCTITTNDIPSSSSCSYVLGALV